MADDTFSFTVTNNSELAIAELWTSPEEEPEDDDWYPFVLPEDGIAPGQTVTIVWDERTNDSPCEWWIGIIFEDESESDPYLFDFCQNPDLVVG
jgi:hypothetical protein